MSAYPAPPALLGILRTALACVVLLFSACGFGPEAWEPDVLSVLYTKNGATAEVDLRTTGPSIQADSGDWLRLEGLTIQLYPTRRTNGGSRIVRVKDLPTIPSAALSLEYRVVATLRKWDDSGPCYETGSQLVTPWYRVKAKRWQINPASPIWELSEEVDEIRINIEIRDPAATYTINKIDIVPSTAWKRLGSGARKSFFSRVVEAFRGDRNCEE